MVYTEGDTPMLVGLVSWSADCANPLYPGKLKCSLENCIITSCAMSLSLLRKEFGSSL